MRLTKSFLRGAVASVLALSGSNVSHAQGVVPSDFTDAGFRGQLSTPCDFAFLPDGRIVVIEVYTARIRLVTTTGALGTTDPLMTVDSVNANGGESGLLSVAVDPRWPASPYVYVYYDAIGGTTRITRYQASGDLGDPLSGNLQLDPGSKYHVLRDLADAVAVDNGGSLRFGPDSLLFVSLGEDDGDGCAAQDTTNLLGKVLRLEIRNLPAGPGGPPARSLLVPAAGNPFAAHSSVNARLVWALGFRNPFRMHVDGAGGPLFVADVGGPFYDEVNVVSGPGLDYGYPYYEGPVNFGASCPVVVPPFTLPVYYYQRPGAGTNIAVIGGPVYHAAGCPACRFPPEYEGDYFLSDYFQGFLRRLKFSGGSWSIAPTVPGQPSASNWGTGFQEVASWREGPDGALWYCRMATGGAANTGQIRRIVYSGLLGVGPRAESAIWFAPPAPSPALGEARLEFSLAREGAASLVLYDVGGRPARVLLRDDPRSAGTHRVSWDGRLDDGMPAVPGLYFALLRVGGEVRRQRIAFLR